MEAAGPRLRVRGVAAASYRNRVGLLRRRSATCRLPQQFHAANSGQGPSGVPPGDVNDALAPVIFRFTDGPTGGNSSTGPSSIQGGAWTGIITAGSNASSSSIVPMEAPPRVSTGGPASSSMPSPQSTSREGRDAVASDAPQPHSLDSLSSSSSSTYSDFYRKANTSFQRSAANESPVNGWSHGTRPASPSHAAPSPASEAFLQNNSALPSSTSSMASAETSTTNSDSGVGNGASSADSVASPPQGPLSSDCGPDSATEVTAALARAQAALARAETSLDDIQRLSSSLDAAALESLRRGAPPGRWSRLLSLAKSAALMGGMTVALLASHAFGLAVQWAGAVAGAAAIAYWGLRRKSLAPSGAAAALLVGCGTLGSSLRFGATLVAFFLSSSKLTAYKEELKEGLEEGAKKGGQRTWVQVLCNGLVPTILAVVYGVLAGCVDLPLGPPAAAAATLATGPALEPWRAAALTALMGGFLGYYACCCGDTWASELGPLSADTPRLITSLRPVRRGTNGGVTLLGLSASIMGGMFVGLVFYLAGLLSPTLWIFESQRALAAGQWRLIPLGLMAGLFGSALDSLLGATLQYSGYDRRTGRIVSRPGPDVTHIAGLKLLDNNAVNALSATATSALTAFAALKTFGF